MKLLSLFSGIGAFEKALNNLGVDYDLVGYSEINKYASVSYCAVHGADETKNLGDIQKIDENGLPRDIDLITYGFPCQDISTAGKMKGFKDDEGNQTRSGLFYDALRIIETVTPKVAIAENVKNLVSKKFTAEFESVLSSLEQAGYNNYWKVLNAKNYGIPQNRERVFIVSIRKDIDNGLFYFPDSIPLVYRLKDFLESEVDKKYYLSDAALKYFVKRNEINKEKGNGFKWEVRDPEGCATCLTSSSSLRITDNTVCQRAGDLNYYKYDMSNRVYSKDGVSPTLMAEQCTDDKGIKVLVAEGTKKGYSEAFEGDSINMSYPNSKSRRGRVGKGMAHTLTTQCNQVVIDDTYRSREPRIYEDLAPTLRSTKTFKVAEPSICASRGRQNENGVYEQQLEIKTDGTANTLTGVQKDNMVISPEYIIRRLTPLEYWLLMGFDEKDFNKARSALIEKCYKGKDKANSQLYKQAGNSIVVNVLQSVFEVIINLDLWEL